MPSCAIYGCLSYSRKTKGGDVRYYSFPKDEYLSAEWINACCRTDKINVQQARICSKHFLPSALMKSMKHELLNYKPTTYRDLKNDAMPTEFLPNPKHSVSSIKNKILDIKIESIGQEDTVKEDYSSNDFETCMVSPVSETAKAEHLEIKKESNEQFEIQEATVKEDHSSNDFRTCMVSPVSETAKGEHLEIKKESNEQFEIQEATVKEDHSSNDFRTCMVSPVSETAKGENLEIKIESNEQYEIQEATVKEDLSSNDFVTCMVSPVSETVKSESLDIKLKSLEENEMEQEVTVKEDRSSKDYEISSCMLSPVSETLKSEILDIKLESQEEYELQQEATLREDYASNDFETCMVSLGSETDMNTSVSKMKKMIEQLQNDNSNLREQNDGLEQNLASANAELEMMKTMLTSHIGPGQIEHLLDPLNPSNGHLKTQQQQNH